MDEEQKKWLNQYARNFGAKEFLRFGCSFMIWIFIGAGISIAFSLAGYSWGSVIFVVFLIGMFFFPFVSRSSKPMYSLTQKILGNENLPTEPMPGSIVKIQREPLPWLCAVPGALISGSPRTAGGAK